MSEKGLPDDISGRAKEVESHCSHGQSMRSVSLVAALPKNYSTHFFHLLNAKVVYK